MADRLLIVSHTPHHRRDDEIVGWAPTIRELDQLAGRFARVRHVACLYPGDAPTSAIPYRASNIELVPVPPAGGDGLRGKLGVLRVGPHYARTIHRELLDADMVHVRAPANIAIVAMAMLWFRRAPRMRWFKYAGNWSPRDHDHATYALQRWWLSRAGHGGIVTVNGRWPNQPAFVREFRNPSLDNHDLDRGKRAAERKVLRAPFRLVFVGALNEDKGTGRALRILATLRSRGVDARLDVLGDGPDRARFEALARELQLTSFTRFLGWQPPAVVHAAYEDAHFLVLPSATEGWPKVLSEGMAFGVVPLAGDVSGIRGQLADLQIGAALPVHDVAGFADAIAAYVEAPTRWATESARAIEAAPLFSFQRYLSAVDELVAELSE